MLLSASTAFAACVCKARRQMALCKIGPARRARLAVRVGLAVIAANVAPQATAEGAISAEFGDPTRRYGHAVLGDDIEYGSLIIRRSHAGSSPNTANAQRPVSQDTEVTVRLPVNRVFEDVRPRIVDVDLDGEFEVMVVETEVTKGAQLAIYDSRGTKIAQTPHIGQARRWLAPVAGAADLDGDGTVEVAYVDRPHLAKTLRVWRFRNGALEEVAQLPGVTNHNIGQDFITSGLRDCGDGAEIIIPDANWRRILAVRFDGSKLSARDLGRFSADRTLAKALSCAD